MMYRLLPLLLLSACSAPLPGLIDLDQEDDLPRRLSFLAQEAAPVPGSWVDLQVEVRGGGVGEDRLLSGERLSFSLPNLRQSRGTALELAEGSSCVSDGSGLCRIALRLGVERGDWILAAQADRNPAAMAEYTFTVPLGSERKLTLAGAGLAESTWRVGDPSPWQAQALRLGLNEAGGLPLSLALLDEHGNPVVGEEGRIRAVLSADEEGTCAGPCFTAGASRVDLLPDGSGQAQLELLPGDRVGRFSLALTLNDSLGQEQGLSLEVVVAGRQPARLSLLEGATASCARGDALREGPGMEPALRGVVQDADGLAVQGVEFRVTSDAVVMADRAVVSDEQGILALSGTCPSSVAHLAGGRPRIFVEAVEYSDLELEIPVDWQGAAPSQLTYVPTHAGETEVTAGQVVLLRFQVRDHLGGPVAGATLAASARHPADERRLTLAQEDGSYGPERLLRADGDGFAVFELRPVGPRTRIDQGLELLVEARTGDQPRVVLPIDVLAGSPARITVQQGEGLHLLVGEGGASLAFRVDDGEGSANPVAGVEVQIQQPEGLVLAPDHGFTGADGLFFSHVLEVLSPGEHVLQATASWTAPDQQVWTDSVEVTIIGGQGEVGRISVYRGDERLAPETVVNATVGALLAEPLTVRVENERFGALPDQPVGLLLEPGQAEGAEGCGNGPTAGDGLRTDAETGALILGGAHGADWLQGTLARDCVWRLSSGRVETTLRLQQQAGQPEGGAFEAVDPAMTLAMHSRRPAVFDGDDGGTVEVSLRVQDRFANPVIEQSVIFVPSNCYVRDHFVRPDATGRIATLVTGGPSVDEDCVLSVWTQDGWLPPTPRLTLPVVSEPSRFGRWAFEGLRRYVVHDPDAPRQGDLALDLHDPDDRLVFPEDELDGELVCGNMEACAQVELLFLGDPALEAPPLLLRAAPAEGLILRRLAANHYRADLPQELLRHGGRYGFRLRNPDGARGPIEPFFVLHRPTFLRDSVIVSAVAGAETVQVFDAFVDEQQLLACGLDELGSWVAATALGDADRRFKPLPDQLQAQRLSSGQWQKMGFRLPFERQPLAFHQPGWGLCQTDDVDGDGDQDLLITGPDGGNQFHRPCVEVVFSDGLGGFERDLAAVEGVCDGTASCSLRLEGDLAVMAYCSVEFPEGGSMAALSVGPFDRDGNQAIEVAMGSWADITQRPGGTLPTQRYRIVRSGALGQGGLLHTPAQIEANDRGTGFKLPGSTHLELTGGGPTELFLNPYYHQPVYGAVDRLPAPGRQSTHLIVGSIGRLRPWTNWDTGNDNFYRMAPGGRYLLTRSDNHQLNIRVFDVESLETRLMLAGVNFAVNGWALEQSRLARGPVAIDGQLREVVFALEDDGSVRKYSLPDFTERWSWTPENGDLCYVTDLVWDGSGPVYIQVKDRYTGRERCAEDQGLWWIDSGDGRVLHHVSVNGLPIQPEGAIESLQYVGRSPFVVSADYSRILIHYRQAEVIDGIGGRLVRVAQVHAQAPWLTEVIPRWMTWRGYGRGNVSSIAAGATVLSADGRYLLGMGNSDDENPQEVPLQVWRYDFQAPPGEAALLQWPWRPDWLEAPGLRDRYRRHLPVFVDDETVSLTTATGGGFEVNPRHDYEYWSAQRWVRQSFSLRSGVALGWPEYWQGHDSGDGARGYRADMSVPDANGDGADALRIARWGVLTAHYYRAVPDGSSTEEGYREVLPGIVVDQQDLDTDGQDEIVLIDDDTIRIWQGKRPVEHCGNGRLEQGERCDNGPGREGEACPMDCRSVCGDGQRSSLEACDDGNDQDGDGCSADCEIEIEP